MKPEATHGSSSISLVFIKRAFDDLEVLPFCRRYVLINLRLLLLLVICSSPPALANDKISPKCWRMNLGLQFEFNAVKLWLHLRAA